MAITPKQIRESLPEFKDYSDADLVEHGKKLGVNVEVPDATNFSSNVSIPFLKGVNDLSSLASSGLSAVGADNLSKELDLSRERANRALTARQTQQARENQSIINDDGISGSGLSQAVFQSLPGLISMAAPGHLASKGVQAVTTAINLGKGIETVAKTGALGKGLASGLGNVINQGLGFGAAEGLVSGASDAAQARDQVRETPFSTLINSNEFRHAYHNETDANLPHEQRMEMARDIVANKTGNQVFKEAGIETAAIGALTGGGALGMMERGAGDGLLRRIGKGFATEGLQESAQSGAEQFAINRGMKNYANPDQQLTEGVGQAMAEGGLVGGLLGAAGGSIAGRPRVGFGDKKQPDELPQTDIETGNKFLQQSEERKTGNQEGQTDESNRQDILRADGVKIPSENWRSALIQHAGLTPEEADAHIQKIEAIPVEERTKENLTKALEQTKLQSDEKRESASGNNPARPPIETANTGSQGERAPSELVQESAKSQPSELDAAAHEAATLPANAVPEPTQAQKEAGNYKKGKVTKPAEESIYANRNAGSHAEANQPATTQNQGIGIPGGGIGVSPNGTNGGLVSGGLAGNAEQQLPGGSEARQDNSNAISNGTLVTTPTGNSGKVVRVYPKKQSAQVKLDQGGAEIHPIDQLEINNAIEKQSTAQSNGSGGQQSEVRQESGSSAGSSQGVRGSGQAQVTQEINGNQQQGDQNGQSQNPTKKETTATEALKPESYADEMKRRADEQYSGWKGKERGTQATTEAVKKQNQANQSKENQNEKANEVRRESRIESRAQPGKEKPGFGEKGEQKNQEVTPEQKITTDKSDGRSVVADRYGLATDAKNAMVEKKPIHEARKEKFLSQLKNTTRYGVTTKGKFIEKSIADGWKPEIDINEDKYYKDKQKLSEHDAPAHATRLMDADAKALREKLKDKENYRTTHVLTKGDHVYDISKIEYDHAKSLLNAKPTNQTSTPEAKPAQDKPPVSNTEPSAEQSNQDEPKADNNNDQSGGALDKGDIAEKAKADQDFNDALADLGDVFGKNFKMNLTPEQEQKLMPVLTRLMDAAFRKGYYKFKDTARFVLNAIRAHLGNDVADEITLDHLQGAYIGMAGRYQDKGADTKRDVINVESLGEIEDVQHIGKKSAGNSEVVHAEPGNEGVIQPGSQAANEMAGRPSQKTGETRNRRTGNSGVSDSLSVTAGEQGNQSVHPTEGRFEPASDSSGDNVDTGSLDDGLAGMDVNPVPESTIESVIGTGASHAEKLEAQRAAESVKVIPGDRANIDKTLPFLMEGQREDVHFAEQRWLKPDGYGVLFTNGTGTGKTYLGLGAIKRLVKQGKTNGIIVVPNEAVIKAWTDSAPSLNLIITPLTDTKDAGKGVVITTYANFGQNDEIAKRKHDFVMIDEAHTLMMSKGADATEALDTLRAISFHPDGAYDLALKRNRDLFDKIQTLSESITNIINLRNADDTMQQMQDALGKGLDAKRLERDKLKKEWDSALDKAKTEVSENQGEKRPRVMFLSATPFAYEQNVQWANGYLFDYPKVTQRGYNTPSPYGQFMINHFGWRMRTGKLTEPDAKVDRDLMQRNFNTWLRTQGALSTRVLDVDHDYERKFILIEGGVGQKIDDGLRWLRETDNGRYWSIYSHINEKFDYLTRQRLLEAFKAKASIDYIQKHHALGRKVVVFYDFNTGGGGENVFSVKSWLENSKKLESAPDYDLQKDGIEVQAKAGNAKTERVPMSQLLEEFIAARPELQSLDFSAFESPLNTLLDAFPHAGVYNGMSEFKKKRIQAIQDFNDDSKPDANLLLVQKAANSGWSGHDTSGKHMRVLINLGQPTAPIEAIQQEGRIYRVGQMSDANFQYFNTGTNWERYAFGSRIARRAGTAENLAMGEQARGLREAFIQAFENSDPDYAPGPQDGKGGKETDRALVKALTEFDRAKALYYGQQKKNSRTKAAEGVDYFATPEPLGLKMVEWGNIIPGDRLLEPSAGHGAIARWFPQNNERTVIEPSLELASRLTLATDAKLINDQFENHDTINKHDVIVMNPPFGSGGKTAIDHIDKAFKHLPDGGRIVALIPDGPAADAKFEKWLHGKEQVKSKPVGESEKFGDIYKGDTATYLPDPIYTGNGYVEQLPISGEITDVRNGLIYIKSSGKSYSIGKLENSITNIKKTGSRTELKPIAQNAFLRASIGLPTTTFERAGTSVKTRVVIIDKIMEPARQRELQANVTREVNAETPEELFDAIENMGAPERSLPKEKAEVIAQSTAKQERIKATTTAYEEAGQVQPEGAEASIQELQGDKLLTDAPRIEYVTKKGKKIYGVIAKGITKAQAEKADPYTWAKDGGFFIRMEHVIRPELPKFSKGQEAGSTIKEITDLLPRRVKKLVDAGKLEVVQSVSDLPANLRGIGEALGSVFYHGTNDVGANAILKDKKIKGKVFLTPREDIAFEYAGDNGRIFQVDIDPSELEIDLDMPGQRTLSVKDANRYTENDDYDIYDYINNGYSVAINKDIDVNESNLLYSNLAGIQGLYDNKTDKLYLVADMLDKSNISEVLSHELLHRAEFTDKVLKAAIDRFENIFATRFKLASNGKASLIENRAAQRVIQADTPLANQLEEFRAYQVSEYAKNPDSFVGVMKKAFQDFVSAIRMALFRAGLDLGMVKSLSPADLMALSKYGAALNIGESRGNIGEVVPESNNILYSKSSEKLRSDISSNLIDLLSSSKKFGNIRRTFGTSFGKAVKDKDFKRVFDAAMRLEEDVARYSNKAADLAPGWLPNYDNTVQQIKDVIKMRQIQRDHQAISESIFDSTLNDKPFDDAELEKKGMTPRQIKLYHQFYDGVNKSMNDLAESELRRKGRQEKMNAAPTGLSVSEMADYYANQSDTDEIGKTFTDIADKVEKLQSKAYAPLMRFGRHSVDVYNIMPDGAINREAFYLFETDYEANKMARVMKEQYPEHKVDVGVISEQDWEMFRGITPDTMQMFAKMMGIEKDEAFQEYLRLAISNNNALKRLIHRKKVPGFVKDPQRVLAQFIVSNSRQIARNNHMGEIMEAISNIPKSKGDVKDEAIEMWKHIQAPSQTSAKWRGLLFGWYMGGSVASAFVNSTQTFTTTLPYLHQFGESRQVAKIIKAAMLDAANHHALTGDIAEALKRAEEEGVTAPHELYGITEEASRIGMGYIPQLGSVNKAVRPFVKLWGSMFQSVEAYNRRVAFIAAYRLAEQIKHPDPFAFAEDAVKQTQFVYSKANQPAIARSQVGAVVMTFKMFMINYIEFLGRLPKKERALALAILVLAAGTSGFPFAEDAEDAIDTVGQGLGYNTNSKEWIDQLVQDTVGNTMSQFVQHGISSISPIDLSGRLGLGNIIPGSATFKRSDTDKMRDVMEFAGAGGALIGKAVESYELAQSGQGIKAARALLPKALNDLAQAYDMSVTGQYNDYKGRKVVETDQLDAIGKALGFQPQSVAAPRLKQRYINQDAAMVRNVMGDVSDLWAQGIVEHDKEKIAKAKQIKNEWNEKNPDTKVIVKMSSIMQKVRKMRETSAERLLKSTPKQMRRYASEMIDE